MRGGGGVGRWGGEEELDESFIVSAKFLINYRQKQKLFWVAVAIAGAVADTVSCGIFLWMTVVNFMTTLLFKKMLHRER